MFAGTQRVTVSPQDSAFNHRHGMSTTERHDVAGSAQERLVLLLIAILVVLIGFSLHGGVGLNIADEGYLWDGVRRTAAGDVPIRDFHSYDPGRYYWSAAWSYIVGDGLLGLRFSTSVFRMIGVFLGLLLARRVTSNPIALLLFALLMLWWNPTYYKTIEATVSIASVYAGVMLIEKPSARRFLFAGVVAGSAAVFGRNLGLYVVAAQGLVIAFLALKRVSGVFLSRSLLSWVCGIVAGYAPILAMCALIPGFFDSFLESIAFHFWIGQTNLTLPIPWPWSIDPMLPRLDYAVGLAVGTTFLLWAVVVAVALLTVLRIKSERIRGSAVLVSSTFSALCFAHHPYSRADYEHLAHVIPPLLFVVLAGVLGGRRQRYAGFLVSRTAFLAGCAAITVLATLPYNFPAQYYGRLGPRWQYVRHNIGGEMIRIPVWQVEAIQMFDGVISQHLHAGNRFFIGPYEAGYYAVLGQPSPLWNSYFVLPEMETRQRRMIREFDAGNVDLALVNDHAAVDGNAIYRFRNSHPLVWQYLCTHFHPNETSTLPPGWILFSRGSEVDTVAHLVERP